MAGFTAIVGDVGLQPGTKLYNCFASGTLYKGQGVYIVNPPANYDKNLIWVGSPKGSSNCLFGVTAFGAATTEAVSVFGPYNLCRVRLSGSQTAGTQVGLYHGGTFYDLVRYPGRAVVVEGVTTSGEGTVLLLGAPSGAL